MQPIIPLLFPKFILCKSLFWMGSRPLSLCLLTLCPLLFFLRLKPDPLCVLKSRSISLRAALRKCEKMHFSPVSIFLQLEHPHVCYLSPSVGAGKNAKKPGVIVTVFLTFLTIFRHGLPSFWKYMTTLLILVRASLWYQMFLNNLMTRKKICRPATSVLEFNDTDNDLASFATFNF